jgi:ketosteroid isomerase-like protein
MSIEENVQIVKDFFAAIGRFDMPAARAFCAEDIEWIMPGEDWPLAGTRCWHAGVAGHFKTHSETMETSLLEVHEFIAQGDRVMVVGFARGK